MSEPKSTPNHRWRFFRSGGFDQVSIENADDLRQLRHLDPKLWTVLNCPAQGLEFDARTATLIDTDGDGQLRVPEIVGAVEWALGLLRDGNVLFAKAGLKVEDIDSRQDTGRALTLAARGVLTRVGKASAAALDVADFADPARLFPPAEPNGDGIVPAALARDETLAAVIADIIASQGAATDRSGEPGVTADTITAFFAQAREWQAWQARPEAEAGNLLPLGTATAAALAALEAVERKVEDYYTRCRLAAFDARAAAALNPAEGAYTALAAQALSGADADIAALPLAEVGAGKSLPLSGPVNPAWAAPLARLVEVAIEPLLGPRSSMSEADWAQLRARLSAYRDWLGSRPALAVDTIPAERLQAALVSDAEVRLQALVQQDLAADTSAATIDGVEKLVRLQRDLVTLLRNFVTLSEFYRGSKAIFQAGTLYLDQRSCELVLRVADMGRHSAMAPYSGCFLVYCTCSRPGEAPLDIVAALTGGEVDELMVPGRNGVFYDRQGRDWKATVVKVVEQAVSLRQAFWSPYRKVGRFIEAQVQKFAASREDAVNAKAEAGVGDAGGALEAGKTPAAGFDIARFAGIFAAIGLAFGAIGTALAAIVSGLLSLPFWQLPLVVVGVMLLVSGPSMLMAALKLRSRNLGPLLDANGWAVNARARINIPFGESLTALAKLPTGAERSSVDPFAEKQRPWRTWLLVLILLGSAGYAWHRGWIPTGQPAPAAAPAAEEPVPTGG